MYRITTSGCSRYGLHLFVDLSGENFSGVSEAASIAAATQQKDDPQTAVILIKSASTAAIVVSTAAEQYQQKNQCRAGIAAEYIGDASGILTSASTVCSS